MTLATLGALLASRRQHSAERVKLDAIEGKLEALSEGVEKGKAKLRADRRDREIKDARNFVPFLFAAFLGVLGIALGAYQLDPRFGVVFLVLAAVLGLVAILVEVGRPRAQRGSDEPS